MPTPVTPEMIETFRKAWLRADVENREGFRIQAGLEAVLATLPEHETQAVTHPEVQPIWAAIEALSDHAAACGHLRLTRRCPYCDDQRIEREARKALRALVAARR